MRQTIEERAAAYADDQIGQYGLHSVTYTIGGSREHPVLVEKWRMDHGLLRAMREIENQATIETGQWARRHEAPYKGPTMEEVMQRREAGLERVRVAKAERAAELAA